MVAELPDDLILQQIITRLPLKYAVQCRILNKHFHKAISMHALLLSSPRSSTNSIVFHHSIMNDLSVMNDLSYSEDFYLVHQGSFSPVMGKIRPVYGHGFVHWLGAGATAMVAFDVETGRARVMRGPVTDFAIYLHKRIWFGFARGSLQFVILFRYSIMVHTHDYIAQEWRVAHDIATPDYLTGLGRRPVFFDGEKNVYVHVQKRYPGDKDSNIYVHDLSTGKWDVIGEVNDGRQHYSMEFVPTMARVSDVYVSDMLAEGRSTTKGLCLRALQHLFLDSCS